MIREHRWSVLDGVSHNIDFGLIWVDCTPFKEYIVKHCDALELTIADYVRAEFFEKMKAVKSEIGMVKGRLDEDAQSIDDVMALLDYIDSLKKSDNKVEEIADFIDLMQK